MHRRARSLTLEQFLYLQPFRPTLSLLMLRFPSITKSEGFPFDKQIQRPNITSAPAAVSYCFPKGEKQAVWMGVTEKTQLQYPGREEKPKGSVAPTL